MQPVTPSNTKIARSAGILYVLLVGIALYGMGYVPSKIFVRNDVTATTANLLVNEFLFRTGIISHLLSVIAISIMVLMLYRLFTPVDKHLSRLMVVPVLVQIPIVLIIECFNIAALMILKGEAWMNLDVEQRQQYAYFLLGLHSYGIGASQLFWGLWLFPFGMLVKRSAFLPRIFGILLIINGAGYVAEGCAFILLPGADYLVVRQFARYTFIGLPFTMLWLLIRGILQSRVTV